MEYKPTYNAVHKWLAYQYGSADKCEQCNTKKAKKYEWALLRGKEYEKKRNNFWQLCTSCHVVYDGKIEKLTKVKLKPVMAEGNTSTMYFKSTKEAVRLLEISNTAISNNLTGRSKSSGGYTWSYAV